MREQGSGHDAVLEAELGGEALDRPHDEDLGEFRSTGQIPPVMNEFREAPPSASQMAFGAAPSLAHASPVLAVASTTSSQPAAPALKKAKRGTPFADQVTSPTNPSYDDLSGAKTLGGQTLSSVATTKAEATTLNALRAKDRRFNAIALAQAQGVLGVSNATGAFNTETLRKLAARKGAQTADSIVQDDTWVGIYAGTEPLFLDAVGGKGTSYDPKHPDRTHTDKADRSARGMGYKNYNDYKGTLHEFTFLGVQGKGQVHEHLQARLTAAEKFLVHKHGSAENAIKATGWKKGLVGSYNTSEEDRAAGHVHYHTMGLAVDFDADINPWLYPESELKRQRAAKVESDNKKIKDGTMTGELYDAADSGDAAAEWWTTTLDVAFMQAAALFHGYPLTKDKMLEWSQTLSSEELYARVSSAASALKKYYDLAKTGDDDKIVRAFTSAGFTDKQARDALSEMKAFPGRFDGGFKRSAVKGTIMTHSLDLVVALRDVAGLTWGGTEMSSGDNGDFMHFDCRNTALGKSSRDFRD